MRNAGATSIAFFKDAFPTRNSINRNDSLTKVISKQHQSEVQKETSKEIPKVID